MADQAEERLKALKASIKEALGKLTGNDELAAQGARERSGKAERKVERHAAPPAKKRPAARASKGGKGRRSS